MNGLHGPVYRWQTTVDHCPLPCDLGRGRTRGSPHGDERSFEQLQALTLVGTKGGLEDQRTVTVREAEAFASSHGMSYVETSAEIGVNVRDGAGPRPDSARGAWWPLCAQRTPTIARRLIVSRWQSYVSIKVENRLICDNATTSRSEDQSPRSCSIPHRPNSFLKSSASLPDPPMPRA